MVFVLCFCPVLKVQSDLIASNCLGGSWNAGRVARDFSWLSDPGFTFLIATVVLNFHAIDKPKMEVRGKRENN